MWDWGLVMFFNHHPVLKTLAPIGENEWRPNLAGTCYNQMIHPVVPYSIAGAIWYQGETNVGLRLANLALAETYHQPINDYLSPTFLSMEIEKDKIIITFKNVQSGLVCKGEKIEGLKISGDNGE